MGIQGKFSLLVICFLIIKANHAKDDLIDIIGGSAADISQFPYQVSLRSNNRFFCGGIIIDNRNVLTAAHCVCDDNYSNCPVSTNGLTIVAGSTTLSPIGYEGVQINVEKIFIHEKYVTNYIYANDIAVLRLSQDLKFCKTIKAYPLAVSTPHAGTECIATGWGMTSIIGNISNTLRQVSLSTIGHKSCALFNNIFNKVLCTDRGGKKPFKGDSGGALNCGGKIAGIASLVGLFEIFPSQFTDIAQYKTWIDVQLKRKTSTVVRFNLLYYIYVLTFTYVYSFVLRFFFLITSPLHIIINIIRRIFPWLF